MCVGRSAKYQTLKLVLQCYFVFVLQLVTIWETVYHWSRGVFLMTNPAVMFWTFSNHFLQCQQNIYYSNLAGRKTSSIQFRSNCLATWDGYSSFRALIMIYKTSYIYITSYIYTTSIVNFEHISHFVLVFLLLTLNM